MKLPFFKFYPADFKAATCLLSLPAKGAWIDILCMLHGSESRGTLTFSVQTWARIIGGTVPETEAIISELEQSGVASVTLACNGDVTLTNRRMTKDAITLEQTRLRVMHHRQKMACNATVTPPCNANVTPKKLEARSQKLEDITCNALGRGAGETGHHVRESAPAAPTLTNATEELKLDQAQTEKPKAKKPRTPKPTDAEWLAGLKTDPAFTGTDIDREFAKATRWCSEHNRKCSRQFFCNWLNRAERGISAKPTNSAGYEHQKRIHGDSGF